MPKHQPELCILSNLQHTLTTKIPILPNQARAQELYTNESPHVGWVFQFEE